ncbi:MAG TPA: ABC transporter substrate-binding protein, partial [Pyrinomonadaceae bacterium]|nr:ABC transporter substrate-binding protein [Pyrinomonadaceae bacterium]
MKTFASSRGLTIILIIVALGLLTLSSCAKQGSRSGAPGQGGKLKVGFSQMEENNPWRIAETNSMRDEAKKRGDKFELVVTNAQGQTSKQVSDVEDLIAQRVDAIFLAPREFEGLGSALQRAKEAKIPVFLIDREAAGKPGEDFVAFLGSNFVEQGKRAGDWLVKNSNGKAGIVELTGTAGSSVARDRSEGFRDAIKNSPDMKILTSQTGNFSRAEGQKVMENIIQAHGKAITAVYAHNDEMALGAIQALESANMNPGTDVLIISVDGQKSALQAILDGKMNVTIESNPRFGPLAFATLEKFWAGEKLPPIIGIED